MLGVRLFIHVQRLLLLEVLNQIRCLSYYASSHPNKFVPAYEYADAGGLCCVSV
jgi:hypothetical protein